MFTNTAGLPPPSPGIQVTCIIFSVVVAIAIALRLYTRIRITIKFGLDDVFAIVATACAVAMFAVATVAADHYGWNRHMWQVAPTTYEKGHEVLFVYNVMFSQAACQTKLSLLWFTRQLIGRASSGSSFRFTYVALIVLMAVVGICQVLFVLISCLTCRTLKAAWDLHPDYPYTCINASIFLLACGIINTSTDFSCVILPAIIVMKLQMPFRRRLAIASVFLIGISVNVASVLRIYYVVVQYATNDRSYCVPPVIAGSFEIGLGLICVNVPPLRPLFGRYTDSLGSGGRARSSTKSSLTYLSKLRSRQTSEFAQLVGSHELNRAQTPPFSAAARANSERLKEEEKARIVELDTLLPTSHSHSIGERGTAE